jgi:hypothetical protein
VSKIFSHLGSALGGRGVMAVLSNSSRIYTIDVDGKAVVCFPADSWLEAGSSRGRNGYEPISLLGDLPASRWRSRRRNSGRFFATPEETALFEQHRSALGRQPDDLELVYLVELDDRAG